MKEIVNEILQTEKKVEETLRKAREKASEMKLLAEREASQKIEEARKKAQEIISTRLEDERQKARKLKEDKLKKAEENSNAILASNKKKVNALVTDLVELIIQTVHDGKGSE